MVNIFPDLLTFSLLAPFIIRVFLGLYYLSSGFSLLKKLHQRNHDVQARTQISNIVGWVSIIGSLLVLAGFYTQIGALVLTALSFYLMYTHPQNRALYLLLFAVSLSLLFSGAGFFAFDLPL